MDGWVDVPLGRLEQYQRHIDPVPPAGGMGASTFGAAAPPGWWLSRANLPTAASFGTSA